MAEGNEDNSKNIGSENEKLKEFKSYCKSNGYKLPELDEEIFRALHKKLMDVPKAYESIMMQ